MPGRPPSPARPSRSRGQAGSKTNLTLDGTNQPVGTATFATEPTTNDIVLHISDGGQCFDLYGVVTPTCFVLPGTEPGPVCDAGTGNTNAAYNAIPTDVEHCSPPSYAFEGNFANEFGDEVLLDTTGGNGSAGVSLRVDFQSYGCGDAGHWYTRSVRRPLGRRSRSPVGSRPRSTTRQPRRRSPRRRPSTRTSRSGRRRFPTRTVRTPPRLGYPADSRFKDPVSGQCNYSLSVPLTFTFPNHTFTSGQDVVGRCSSTRATADTRQS